MKVHKAYTLTHIFWFQTKNRKARTTKSRTTVNRDMQRNNDDTFDLHMTDSKYQNAMSTRLKAVIMETTEK